MSVHPLRASAEIFIDLFFLESFIVFQSNNPPGCFCNNKNFFYKLWAKLHICHNPFSNSHSFGDPSNGKSCATLVNWKNYQYKKNIKAKYVIPYVLMILIFISYNIQTKAKLELRDAALLQNCIITKKKYNMKRAKQKKKPE
jgi:hypothetical protein